MQIAFYHLLPCPERALFAQAMSAVPHTRHCPSCHKHICGVSQRDMSAVSHRRHVCYVTQQTCPLFDTTEMSAVCHSRHVGSVT